MSGQMKKMRNNPLLKINDILNSDSNMIKNFYIDDFKDKRIKVVKKKGQQFIIIHMIVEKKNGLFWNKEYMESFPILPDPLKELKIIKVQDFEIMSYEQILPDKTTVIDFDKLNIIDLIMSVYSNYMERIEIANNIPVYEQTINEWSKLIDDQIKGISEAQIEITE